MARLDIPTHDLIETLNVIAGAQLQHYVTFGQPRSEGDGSMLAVYGDLEHLGRLAKLLDLDAFTNAEGVTIGGYLNTTHPIDGDDVVRIPFDEMMTISRSIRDFSFVDHDPWSLFELLVKVYGYGFDDGATTAVNDNWDDEDLTEHLDARAHARGEEVPSDSWTTDDDPSETWLEHHPG
jgi:hypothetical protein